MIFSYISFLNIYKMDVYLIFDNKFNLYLYINYKNNKIKYYQYIINYIYIFFIFYQNFILYLLPKLYKCNYIKYNNKLYYIILSIIGINYICYALYKYNILILKLKYSHNIFIKLPITIKYKINIMKSYISLESYDFNLLSTISRLIQSLQYVTKYKNIGISINKKERIK